MEKMVMNIKKLSFWLSNGTSLINCPKIKTKKSSNQKHAQTERRPIQEERETERGEIERQR